LNTKNTNATMLTQGSFGTATNRVNTHTSFSGGIPN